MNGYCTITWPAPWYFMQVCLILLFMGFWFYNSMISQIFLSLYLKFIRKNIYDNFIERLNNELT